jgi:hypothetical protein
LCEFAGVALFTKPKSIKSLNASGTNNSVADPKHSNTNAKNTRERYGRKNGHRLLKEESFLVGDLEEGLSAASMLIISLN